MVVETQDPAVLENCSSSTFYRGAFPLSPVNQRKEHTGNSLVFNITSTEPRFKSVQEKKCQSKLTHPFPSLLSASQYRTIFSKRIYKGGTLSGEDSFMLPPLVAHWWNFSGAKKSGSATTAPPGILFLSQLC